MNALMKIKQRYDGIQNKFERMYFDGCLFLVLCTIIEEVTGSCDIIEVIQYSMEKGWLGKDYFVHDSLSILNKWTGKNFRRTETTKLPSEIRENEFTVEKWFNPRTDMVHFKRRFVDTLTSSVTVKEGFIMEYYIYSY